MLQIGSSLAEARRRRGLELAEVEAATLIRGRYLRALEQEEFELLPAGLYRRSFLREYAAYLGLDGEIFVAEYDLRCAALEPVEPPPEPPRAGKAIELASRIPVAWAAALVVAAIAVLAGLAIWSLAPSEGAPAAKAPPHAARVDAPTRAVSQVVDPAPTVPKAPVRHSPPALTLTAAHGPCWILVRSGSSAGAVVDEQMVQAGQSVRFGLRAPLWVELGAPWNLTATVGRRAVTGSLPSTTGEVLASSSGLQPAT